jgi:hypothetical protein
VSNHLQEAFDRVCAAAVNAEQWCVSLYLVSPFYGGPEEGGWWGTDYILEASQAFPTREAAEAAAEAVETLAEELAKEARRTYGEQCLRETEWLEKRGLDDDFLPEVDGPFEYRVLIEQTAGEAASRGCRHYE